MSATGSDMGGERPTFAELLQVRLARRRFLQAGLAVAGAAALGSLAGCERTVVPTTGGPRPLHFTPVAPSSVDEVIVPDGYMSRVLIKWGDPLRAGLPDFDVDSQTADDQEARFGFNNDFLALLDLPKDVPDANRGLLWVNHESTHEIRMFRSPPWALENVTCKQVDIALAAHGGSVVEVVRDSSGAWSYVGSSCYNRRITATTPMIVTGPAAGHRWLQTRGDPTGCHVLGMLGNCSGGVTPWGTILTAEENFDVYFSPVTEEMRLPDEVREAHKAYFKESRNPLEFHGWERHYPRFNLEEEPYEPFRFGWIVEVDPYDPYDVPKKRTALGRFKHEAAVTVLSKDNRPVVYSGDDDFFQYVYKFVGDRCWRSNDILNRQLLDHGTLYAAGFEADGTGRWLPLVFGTGPLVPENGFTSQGDVLVRVRLAARAAGATAMDRPEDIEVSPRSGHVFLSMTSNKNREPAGDQPNERAVNSANPRPANLFGHVIELIEDKDDPAATSFRWEILLLCGHPDNLVTRLEDETLTSDTSYFAGYAKKGDLSLIAGPDNLVFDDVGHLWIATDGQAKLQGNDALHAVPVEGDDKGRVRQFLSAPVGAEVTGPYFSADYEALFVSIQHPGQADGESAGRPHSTWPHDALEWPRPSVVVVTKDGGGPIGS